MENRSRLFMRALFFTICVTLSVNLMGTTRQNWIDKFNVQSFDAYLSTNDSGTLAWNEAYVMMALLNMYEATGSVQYLGRFIDHADTVMGTGTGQDRTAVLQSPYGAGKSWVTGLYAANSLPYPDGEIADFDDARQYNTTVVPFTEYFANWSGAPLLPAGWAAVGSTVTRDTNSGSTGSPLVNTDSYSCCVATDGGGWRYLSIVVPTGLGPGTYCITFQGKVADTSPTPTCYRGRFRVTDSSGAFINEFFFNDTAWTKYSFLITLTATPSTSIKLWLYAGDGYLQSGFKSYYDNISCVKVDNKIVPNKWTMGGAVTRTNAYLDTTTADLKPNGAGGLGCFAIGGNSAYYFNSAVLWNPYRGNKYEPGRDYQVTFDAKASSSSGGWRIESRDNGSSMTLTGTTQGTNTAWGTYSFKFTAPSTTTDNIQIRLYPKNSTGIAYFDNIIVGEVVPYAAHDGMILSSIAKFIMMVNRGLAPLTINPVPTGTPTTAYSSYDLGAKADTYRDIITAAGAGDNVNLMNKWAFCRSDYNVDISGVGTNLAASVYTMPLDGSFDMPTSTASPDLAPYSLPHNQSLAMAMVYSYLSRSNFGDSSTHGYVSSAASYADLTGKIAASFRSKLIQQGSAAPYTYKWNYKDRMLTTGNIDSIDYSVFDEDTSHGSVDVAAALSFYAAGIAPLCFSADTMKYLANTFYYTMCGGDSGNNYPGDSVTTSTGTAYQYKTWGWIQLAALLPGIYDKTYNFHDSNFSTLGYSQLCVISEIVKGKPLIYETFETPDVDSSLPAGWTRVGTNSTVFRDNLNKVDGSYGLTANCTNANYLQSPTFTLKNGCTYVLKFMGNKESGVANGAIFIRDSNGVTLGKVTFATNTPPWQPQTLTYTNSTGSDITGALLRLGVSNSSGACVHFDNVEFRERLP